MAQSELHWSRWRFEESTRTFQEHVTRLHEGIKPHVPLSSRKEPSYRTRYVQHRMAARQIQQRAAQHRIDEENFALGRKIAHVAPAVSTKHCFSLRKPLAARAARAADRAATRDKELLVSNIALLRRIVAAKPFFTKEDLDNDCKRMQVFLERLRRVREERLFVIQRRMDICKEVRATHRAKLRKAKAKLRAVKAAHPAIAAAASTASYSSKISTGKSSLKNPRTASEIGSAVSAGRRRRFRAAKRPPQIAPRTPSTQIRNLAAYKHDAALRQARREANQRTLTRTLAAPRMQAELVLLQQAVDKSLKQRSTIRSFRSSAAGRSSTAYQLARRLANNLTNKVIQIALDTIVARRVGAIAPAVSPAPPDVDLRRSLKFRKRTTTAQVVSQKAQVMAQLRTTLQSGLTTYLH